MADFTDEQRAQMKAASQEHQSRLLQALWDIAWHTARTIRLRIGGTHLNYSVIEVDDQEFLIDNAGEEDRIIAWADSLRHRGANTDRPGPPERVPMVQMTADQAHELEHVLIDASCALPQIHPDRGRVLAALALVRELIA